MLRSSVSLLIIALTFAASAPARAADPVAKCQSMKIKATGKKTYDKAKCYQKAVAKGVAVDPECLSKAESKFTTAIAKADAAGTCAGSAATLEAAVDDCVTEYRGIVQPPATTTSTTTTSTTTSTIPGPGCGNGVVELGEECDDTDTSPGDGCDGDCVIEGGYSCTGEPSTCTAVALFFSEYVETSAGSDKALEISNPGGASVSLNGCSIRLYTNGSATVSSSVALTGSLAGGGVFVACNLSPSILLAGHCDTTAALNFNGDDALDLQCNGTTLDVIGQIGTDPGAQWGTSPTSTADHTLRRKCSVSAGDTNGVDAFEPATEWSSVGVDDYTGLGDPACAP